jgi:DNA-binding transcriptional LysR family regulator
LTEPGSRLLEQARFLMKQYDSIELTLRNWDQNGVLRVGSSITIGNRFLSDFVSTFKLRHENIRIKVAINSSEKIEAMVLENELDFGLIESVPHHKNIESSIFLKDELVIICAKDHPLAECGQISLDQFSESDLLLREKGSGTRELFDSMMSVHNKSIEPLWESVSTQALVRAVTAGIGLSVLPYWLVQEDLKAETIATLKIPGIDFHRNYFMIHHVDKTLTAPMLDFIKICCSVDFSI